MQQALRLTISDLGAATIVDSQGRRARLIDLAIDATVDDYPPVTHLLCQPESGPPVSIDWAQVASFDPHRAKITLHSLGSALPPETADSGVLLNRDILDALVLDLRNRRATRANDLWLEKSEHHLRLCAADVSVWAIVRRLTRGRLGRRLNSEIYDWKDVEFLRGDPQAVRRGANYHRRITRLPPGEIAALSESLPYLHAAELLVLLPDPLAADTLELMSPERQLQVFEEFDEEQAHRLLCLIAPDATADLLSRLDRETAWRYLRQLPDAARERVFALLCYPEETVGALMTNDIVQAPGAWTVAEARLRLKERMVGPDFVYFIYIVDDDQSGHLQGVMTLRDLLVAEEGQRLDELMNPYVTALAPLDGAIDAAYRLINSQLAALPVVAPDGRLLGALTVDAAASRLAPPGAQTVRIFS